MLLTEICTRKKGGEMREEKLTLGLPESSRTRTSRNRSSVAMIGKRTQKRLSASIVYAHAKTHGFMRSTAVNASTE